MNLREYNFQLWCSVATAGILYKPDRESVRKELMNHMEDHRDHLIAQGLSEKEASKAALEAMGDAVQVGKQLSAIHRPFWGFLLQASKILLVVLLVLSLYPIWDYATDLNLYDRPNLREFDIFSSSSYGGDTGRTLLHLSQPDSSAHAYGNTFTVTDAATFTETTADGETSTLRLCALVRQSSLLPWAEHEQYAQSHVYHATSWFYAQDSQGNIYAGHFQTDPEYRSTLGANQFQSGIFTATHSFYIPDLDPDAQWVDICYDRDGCSFSLRIYLTGGISQ